MLGAVPIEQGEVTTAIRRKMKKYWKPNFQGWYWISVVIVNDRNFKGRGGKKNRKCLENNFYSFSGAKWMTFLLKEHTAYPVGKNKRKITSSSVTFLRINMI